MFDSEPLVITILRQFRAAILAQDASQMALMATRWYRVEQALQGEMLALAQEIAQMQAAGETITAGKVARLERYKRLLAQARAQLKEYETWLEPIIAQKQREYAALGIEAANAAGQAVLGLSFDRLPIGALENMFGMASDGSPLVKLLRGINPDAAAGLTQSLIDAVALGRNPLETAHAMADGFGLGLNRAMTIARTEQIRVYREAQRAQYEASGNFIGYRRMSARKDTTCLACLMADGRFYSLDTPFEEHPNGMCMLVPVARDIPSYEWQLGRDWFMQQSADTQRNIMGVDMYQAWRDGKFELDDVIKRTHSDDWGDALVTKSLKELI